MPTLAPNMRIATFALALLTTPGAMSAQDGSGAGHRSESIVVTVPTVRARNTPSSSGLTIEEFRQGWVFTLASEEFQSHDWLGVQLDGRIVFVPRWAVAMRSKAAPTVTPRADAVVQAGAPAPMPAAAPMETPAPAPVARAARPARPAPASPAVLVAAAPQAAAPEPVRPAASTATVPAKAARAVERAPEPAAASVAALAPAPVPERPLAPAPERPAMSARRPGVDLSVGLLANATRIEATGLTPQFHVAGASFLGAQYRGVGLYVAPEMGTGGRYKSTMLGGGVAIDLIRLHVLRITALGGYTTYDQAPLDSADASAALLTQSFKGTSVGGLASIPFLGPMRLTYRGHYVMAKDAASAQVHLVRHSVGLMF